MPRPAPTLVATLFLFNPSVDLCAGAQVRVEPVAIRAAAPAGRVHGVVRDQDGRGLPGVSVVAMGATVAEASSDRVGRFVLTLAPGYYLLRATRSGYLSTFREPLRVSTSAPLERNITLVRQADAIPSGVTTVPVVDAGDHAHTALAWRLRQMRRVVLRDEAGSGRPEAETVEPLTADAAHSLFDRALLTSMRAASTFFRETNFDGQVNWMTTGWFDVTGDRPASAMTGNVAYLAIGAPIGGRASWVVRGALSAGEPSSWVLLGEYESDAESAHAFKAGVSYGALRPRGTDPSASSVTVGEARTAGAVYLVDRWQAGPGLAVDYGVRVDAYDYLARSPVVSPRVGARVAVTRRASVTVEGLSHAVAPGAAEFQPPAAAGLWMPPDRSFGSIRSGRLLRAERVRELAVGVEYAVGSSETVTVGLRHFRQTSRDQLVTLFGPGSAGASHYLTGAVGDMLMDGWTTRVSGQLSPHVQAAVAYSHGQVHWQVGGARTGRMVALAPSAVRRGPEVLHDVAASLEAEIPTTATRLSMASRISTGFSPADGPFPVPGFRFAIEVRQALPYQPWRGGSLDVLLGIRNLYRDLDDAGSYYDELLTISPPLRFVGGIQVRF